MKEAVVEENSFIKAIIIASIPLHIGAKIFKNLGFMGPKSFLPDQKVLPIGISGASLLNDEVHDPLILPSTQSFWQGRSLAKRS